MSETEQLEQAEYNVKELNKMTHGNYFIRRETLADGTPRFSLYRKVRYNKLGRPVSHYEDAKGIELLTYSLESLAFEEQMAKQEKKENKKVHV